MKKLWGFLGGISFALILIASTAIMVIIGTVLEARTDSHLFASKYIYSNPLFCLLLGGFFVNILVSALRRWPFRRQHIPFLITHVGLLMIIAGSLIKLTWGLQGILLLSEGTGSETVIIPGTYQLEISSRTNPEQKHLISLDRLLTGQILDIDNNKTKITLLEFHPHASYYQNAWIHDDQLYIQGMPSLPVYKVDDSNKELPVSASVRFTPYSSQSLEISAFKGEGPRIIQKAYLEEAYLEIIDRHQQNKLIMALPLKEAILNPVLIEDHSFDISLNLVQEVPCLNCHERMTSTDIAIPLTGARALFNENLTSPHLGQFQYAFNLQHTPRLVFIDTPDENREIIYIDEHGGIHKQMYLKGRFTGLISYDNGFGGYFAQHDIKAIPFNNSREIREKSDLHQLKKAFYNATQNAPMLAPPLEVLQKACTVTKSDFNNCLIAFLNCWNYSGGWLFSNKAVIPEILLAPLSQLDWTQTSEGTLESCQMLCALFNKIDSQKNLQDETLLYTLTQQLFSIPPSATEPKTFFTVNEQARLLSAYFRSYGLHLHHLMMPAENEEEADFRLLSYAKEQMNYRQDPGIQSPIKLESPLKVVFTPEPPLSKLENNNPYITVWIGNEGIAEKTSLPYEQGIGGLRWPALQGKYGLRFQAQQEQLPYRLRLRSASRSNYAGSNQPMSFTCNLIITDTRNGQIEEKTISMNHVHETWEGYRFYLSNITPNDESNVKHIQIAVNYDPAKYWLTYPGAIVLCLGIFLLFWANPYAKNSKRKTP